MGETPSVAYLEGRLKSNKYGTASCLPYGTECLGLIHRHQVSKIKIDYRCLVEYVTVQNSIFCTIRSNDALFVLYHTMMLIVYIFDTLPTELSSC